MDLARSRSLTCSSIFAAFLVYKLARGDFLYWLPIYGTAGLIVSFFIRVVTKVIVDFTALVHFRNEHELGGAYFTFSLCLTPIACLYMGHRYLQHIANEDNAKKLSWVLNNSQVFSVIVGLIFLQIATLTIFLLRIVPRFRTSFLSLRTSCQKSMNMFLLNTEDRVKMQVFQDNVLKWSPIKIQVKEWLNNILPKLLEEQPEWFAPHVKASIPDAFVEDPHILNCIRGKGAAEVLSNRRGLLVGV